MMATRREELIELIKSAPKIEVTPENGLTSEQAEAQRKAGFGNRQKKSVTKTYWQIVCDNVFTFFNIIYFIIVALMIVAGMNVTNYSWFLFWPT